MNEKTRFMRAEERILDFLQSKGGCCERRELNKHSIRTLSWMFTDNQIVRITFARMDGNKARRLREAVLFKPEYARKTFVCLNRTAVVRLLMNGLKLPEDMHHQKAITQFLRECNLTDAEVVAVLWKLGARNWHRDKTRGNIRICGA